MLVAFVTARSPACQSIDHVPDVHAVGRRVRQRDLVKVGADDRRHARAGLVHPLDAVEVVREIRSADVALVRLELGHRGRDLGRHRPRRAGVQLDPGSEGRQRRPNRGELLRVAHEGGNHGRIISTMPAISGPGASR